METVYYETYDTSNDVYDDMELNPSEEEVIIFCCGACRGIYDHNLLVGRQYLSCNLR